LNNFSKNIRLVIKIIFLMGAFYSVMPALGCITMPSANSSKDSDIVDPIRTYFGNFEALAKSENWKEIIVQGKIALEFARENNRSQDEAKICAQLASTAFYSGEYTQVLIYVNRCQELSKNLIDPSLFLRSLYLKSAVYRAFATKEKEEQTQQISFLRAIETAEEAALIYTKKNINNINLQGKIYFNLGAAHADNPKGDLEKAAHCYFIALECFKKANAIDDCIRTNIRLGKIYLLQKQYDLSQQIIDEVRSQISNERLAMHADYLEAQLKLAINDIERARGIAENGLVRAEALGSKEDALRLSRLLRTIQTHAEI
jgi:tetratricopeptide (TPR) repeat protein